MYGNSIFFSVLAISNKSYMDWYFMPMFVHGCEVAVSRSKLDQGSMLSLFLFVVIMNRLTKKKGENHPGQCCLLMIL